MKNLSQILEEKEKEYREEFTASDMYLGEGRRHFAEWFFSSIRSAFASGYEEGYNKGYEDKERGKIHESKDSGILGER